MMHATETPGLESGLTPCYWGSVNQWECDENNHLNVRYFARTIDQAVQLYVSQISDAHPSDVLPAIRSQHIRFLAEARAATPLRVDCAVVEAEDDDSLQVLSLMHDNIAGRVLAAFRTTLSTAGMTLDAPVDKLTDPPELSRPRGLDPATLPPPPASWDQARESGYRIVGRGIIGADECDDSGLLLPHAYVGRISDGMPNLWAFVNPPDEQTARASGELGGAALEQRLDIVEPLRRGSVFTQLSGVRAIGNKTQQMAHVLYDETADRVAALMEAVGVAMDLGTRRAVAISAERRRHLEALLLR